MTVQKLPFLDNSWIFKHKANFHHDALSTRTQSNVCQYFPSKTHTLQMLFRFLIPPRRLAGAHMERLPSRLAHSPRIPHRPNDRTGIEFCGWTLPLDCPGFDCFLETVCVERDSIFDQMASFRSSNNRKK